MSIVGIKFNLLQAASTAEDVAPWVHSVRKWVTVFGDTRPETYLIS